MAEATTEDCKKFIQDNAASLGLPAGGVWKRKSKFKGEKGWTRLFEHGSGAAVHVLEPFGAGAQGLRVEIAPGAQSSGASGASGLDAASEPMKAAMLWRDAMRAIGGAAPIHSEGPGAHGWNWKNFAKANKDFSGNDDRSRVWELTQEWVDAGMSDPAARAMLLDGVSWCFDSDAEFCDKQGYWSAGQGALVAVWPTDAADEFGGNLGNPVYSSDLENSMESVFQAGASAVSGRDAFIKAWDEMQAMGCHFDMAMQKEFNQNSDYDEEYPIDKKIQAIIPELIAQKEAKKIAKATAGGKAVQAKRPRI